MSIDAKQVEDVFTKSCGNAQILNHFIYVLNGLKVGWRHHQEELGLVVKEGYERWSFLDGLNATSGFWAEDFIDNAQEAKQGLEIIDRTSRFFPKLKKLEDVATHMCAVCRQQGFIVLCEKRNYSLKTVSTHIACLTCRQVRQVGEKKETVGETFSCAPRYRDKREDPLGGTDSSLDDV